MPFPRSLMTVWVTAEKLENEPSCWVAVHLVFLCSTLLYKYLLECRQCLNTQGTASFKSVYSTLTCFKPASVMFLLTKKKLNLGQVACILDGVKIANFDGVGIIDVLPVLCINSIRVTTTTLDAYATHSSHNETGNCLFQIWNNAQRRIRATCTSHTASQSYSK